MVKTNLIRTNHLNAKIKTKNFNEEIKVMTRTIRTNEILTTLTTLTHKAKMTKLITTLLQQIALIAITMTIINNHNKTKNNKSKTLNYKAKLATIYKHLTILSRK